MSRSIICAQLSIVDPGGMLGWPLIYDLAQGIAQKIGQIIYPNYKSKGHYVAKTARSLLILKVVR